MVEHREVLYIIMKVVNMKQFGGYLEVAVDMGRA
jgi:hypothetical protein